MYRIKSIRLVLMWTGVMILLAVTQAIGYTQKAGFYLRTDRTEIHEGESFVLEAILENIEARNIRLPDLSPFEVLQGPATSSSMSIINGRQSSSYSHKYVLKAVKKGQFEIAPATCLAAGKTLKTNALKVTVLARKNTSAPVAEGDKATFIRMEASATSVYPGQQLVLDYVLYTRQNLESCNLESEPSTAGFFALPVNDVRDQPQRVQIKGREYYTQVVKRVLLFPQKTGDFTLDPAVFVISLPDDDGSQSFFFRQFRREKVSTNSLRLKVSKLPENAPPSFSGCVGEFTMKTTLKKPTVAAGETVKLELEIKGDGDPNLMRPPGQVFPPGFETYEPSIIYENSFQDGRKQITVKQFEYLAVPQKEGNFGFVPGFSYYSPEAGKYKTIKGDSIRINILPSTGTPVTSNKPAASETFESTKEPSVSDTLGSIIRKPLIVVSMVIVALLTFLGIYLKGRKRQITGTNKSGHAADAALKKLEEARLMYHKGDLSGYYHLLSGTVNGYITEKYKIPHEDSGMKGISSYLAARNTDSEAMELYNQIMQKCELALFAGTYADDASLYDKASRLISLLR